MATVRRPESDAIAYLRAIPGESLSPDTLRAEPEVEGLKPQLLRENLVTPGDMGRRFLDVTRPARSRRYVI